MLVKCVAIQRRRHQILQYFLRATLVFTAGVHVLCSDVYATLVFQSPGDTLSIRAVGDLFTVAVLPDTQFYTLSSPSTFNAQTQWIVDNHEVENIVFVSHLGDIVENGGQGADMNEPEWTVAHTAMGFLDSVAPNLAYGAVLGNHDYDTLPILPNPILNDPRSATQYIKYFGAARFNGRPWYGGSSPDQLNHYQTFSAGGRDFIHVSFEWHPRSSSLSWIQAILDQHPDTPTILSTHEYSAPLPLGRSSLGDTIFNAIVNENSQVFMVLSGHVPAPEFHQTVTNADGLEVFEMLSDYQSRANGGDGWMRLLQFDESNSQINVRTYSPTLGHYETDYDSQFLVTVNFDERFGIVPEPSAILITMACMLVGSHRRRPRKSTLVLLYSGCRLPPIRCTRSCESRS